MADESLKNNTGAGGTGDSSAGTGGTTGGAIATPVKKEEMVSVPKSLIEEILANQKTMAEKVDTLTKDNEKLLYAADKSRLGIFEARNNQGELIRTVNVGIWRTRNGDDVKDHIVLGTKMVFQDVLIEEVGGIRRLVEKQTLRIFLDNGVGKEISEVDVAYAVFYQNVTRVRAQVVGESKNENGSFKKVRFDDGREVELDVNFINY